jgi:hypothetical protein
MPDYLIAFNTTNFRVAAVLDATEQAFQRRGQRWRLPTIRNSPPVTNAVRACWNMRQARKSPTTCCWWNGRLHSYQIQRLLCLLGQISPAQFLLGARPARPPVFTADCMAMWDHP